LLDDVNRASAGTYHVSTAKGIYNELERQLLDQQSHLKRKSALGALITRGATLRFICHDERRPSNKNHSCDAAIHAPSGVLVEAPKPLLPNDAKEGVLAALEGRNGHRSAGVPRIADFPQSQGGKAQTQSNGSGFFSSLFNWMPSCAPVHCSSLEPSKIHSSKIVVPPPDVMAPCIPVPASAAPRSESPKPSPFEAGLGGWPLCIPHAGVALPDPRRDDVSLESRTLGSMFSGPDELEPLAPAVPQVQPPIWHGMCFHEAAIEVDDAELAIVLSPLRRITTPSTVSTTDSQSPLLAFPVSSGACCSRLVFRREDISKIQQWPKVDATRKPGSGDETPPFPHLLEFVGVARGTVQPAVVVLALPSAALVTRFKEGFKGRRPQPPVAMDAKDTVGAVRCELEIDIAVELSVDGNSRNCSAVVQRGICEACHVASDRVQVCGLRNLGGSAPGSLPAEEPSLQAQGDDWVSSLKHEP